MDQILNLNEKDNRNKGLLLSILFHILLLLILLVPCLHYFDPPLENQVIIVAIGVPEVSEVEASSTTNERGTPEPVKPDPVPAKVVPASKSSTESKTKIESKTEEDAPVVAKPEKSKEEIEREKEAAKRELERQKLEEEKRKKDEAKSKFGSLFNKNSETENEEGKGDPISRPDASALEGMSEGFGKTGEGLTSRKILYQPKIEDNSQKTGKVVVNICVRKDGSVSTARFTQKGSTTTDTYLIDLAEKNARKYKFSKSDLVEQCGEIIIDFKLK